MVDAALAKGRGHIVSQMEGVSVTDGQMSGPGTLSQDRE